MFIVEFLKLFKRMNGERRRDYERDKRSRSRSREKEKPRHSKEAQTPSTGGGPSGRSFNRLALGSLIKDQQKSNARMDREELAIATEKLKKYDRTGKEAQLLSKVINTAKDGENEPSDDEYAIEELKSGELVRIHKPFKCLECSQRFCSNFDFENHKKTHGEKVLSKLQSVEKKTNDFLKTLK